MAVRGKARQHPASRRVYLVGAQRAIETAIDKTLKAEAYSAAEPLLESLKANKKAIQATHLRRNS
jgi:hypothetical protein